MLESSMATTDEAVTTAPERYFTLTAVHRCDQCQARAYIRVIVAIDDEWLFCAHHGRDPLGFAMALKPKALDWVDETDAILI